MAKSGPHTAASLAMPDGFAVSSVGRVRVGRHWWWNIRISLTGWWSIFIFTPYQGRWSNLTNIFKWVETTNYSWISKSLWCACCETPCGTASRALKKSKENAVRRSESSSIEIGSFPDGLPNLKRINLKRVRTANRLYSLTGQIIDIIRFLCWEQHSSFDRKS